MRVGLTDFLQQHSGDVAFATVKPQGPGSSLATSSPSWRRSRSTSTLPSPVSGTIVEVNKALELTPELSTRTRTARDGWR